MDMAIIGANIRYWREQRSIGLNELARLSGVDRGNLSKIESGQAGASLDTLAKLASVLKVPVSFLVKDEVNVAEADQGSRRIRLIEWEQVSIWATLGPDKTLGSNMEEHVLLSIAASSEAFALRVKGDAMEPDFRPGDIIVVDPVRKPRPGSFVVAINGNGAPTFKQYRDLGEDDQGRHIFELRPLNQLYPPRRSDREPLRIVGTVISHRRDLE